MAYPTTLDTFTTPTATQKLNNPSHSSIESAQNVAALALETKVGVDSSAVTTTIDYLLKNSASIDPGHLHTSAGVSGTISVAKGGTGVATIPSNALVIGQGTSAVTTVGLGTSGQLLTSNGAGSAPTFQTGFTNLITSDLTQTGVGSNSTSELTVYSFTIKGGTLGTGGVVRIEIQANDIVVSTSGQTATLRYKYGVTTLATATLTGTLDWTSLQVGHLLANAATNSQNFEIFGTGPGIGGTVPRIFQVHGTAAIDSTVDQTFAITIQYSDSQAANQWVRRSLIASKL